MSLILKPPFPRLRRGHPLTNGLVFAAPFYEGSGNKVHDISGRDNNGTLTNMDPNTDWVGSPYGWALDFDGTSDTVLTTGAIDFSNPFSVVIRCKLTGSASNMILFSQNTTAVMGLQYVTATGAFAYQRNDIGGSVGRSFSAITDGAWRTIVFVDPNTGSNANILLYIDGVLITASAAGANANPAANNFMIGGRNSSLGWIGQIESCLRYNRALSESEIAEIYSNPAVIYEPPKKFFLFSSSAPPTQTLTPDAAVVDWVANDATIATGAVTLTPDAADVDWVANDATIVAGATTLAPDAAVVNWTANDATVSAGGTTITTDPAVVDWTANDATIPGGTQILTPDAAVVEWEAVGATLLTQDCPILKGCSLSLFTYSIEAGIQNPEGSDCQLLSGCTDDYFTYQIE